MNKVPQVRVGIMNEPVVDFVLNNEYRVGGNLVAGNQHVEAIDGKVVWNGQQYDELLFEPVNVETDSFTLIDVTIGVSFHWRRKEVQSFRGALHLIVENGKITTVNVLSVEEYLLSVISSEMSAKASLELLKAHAVISRSWLLAQIYKDKVGAAPDVMLGETAQEPGEEIKWWDRDDHINFDVCADDHCQRYQGITRASTETVKKAIEATWGQVLMYGGNLCDAASRNRVAVCLKNLKTAGSHSTTIIWWLAATVKILWISPTLLVKTMPLSGFCLLQPHSATLPTLKSSPKCSTTTTRRQRTSIAGQWNTLKTKFQRLSRSAQATTTVASRASNQWHVVHRAASTS